MRNMFTRIALAVLLAVWSPILIVVGSAAGQLQAAATPPADEAAVALEWVDPTVAFESPIIRNFIQNDFLLASAADHFPKNAVMGFTAERCPDGWMQLEDDDGTPLFYAFGLMVDADGNHRTQYVRVPACVKR